MDSGNKPSFLQLQAEMRWAERCKRVRSTLPFGLLIISGNLLFMVFLVKGTFQISSTFPHCPLFKQMDGWGFWYLICFHCTLDSISVLSSPRQESITIWGRQDFIHWNGWILYYMLWNLVWCCNSINVNLFTSFAHLTGLDVHVVVLVATLLEIGQM